MRALSKKSVWTKLPDVSVTEIGLLPLEWGDNRSGTPWESSSPILSSWTPKPFMTAPEVSPPAEINVPKLSFTSFYFQLFLRLVYKIIGKKITQFILIKKFWFYEYKLAHNNEDIEVGKESEKKIEQYDKEEDNWEILISK